MRLFQNNWLRSVLVTISLILMSLFHLPVSMASNLMLIQTPSTGYQPQFQIFGDKIYSVWHEYDGPFRQIFTAEMNMDGTGWKAEKRTSGQFDKVFPQLHITGNKIYYVRQQPDATKNRQIWTMEMNTDGTGWRATQRTMAGFDKYTSQLQVAGGKVHHVWEELDGKKRQIWTAEVNQDGTGWKAEKWTVSPYGKYDPQFQIVGNKIYYVWHEDHGLKEPIWVAEEFVAK